jgi:uncharacterized membrane-anchored protein YhcB (DUF1043 family)
MNVHLNFKKIVLNTSPSNNNMGEHELTAKEQKDEVIDLHKHTVSPSTIIIPLNLSNYAEGIVNTSIDPKQLIQETLVNVIENMNFSEETISKYFSKDYEQYVDGIKNDYKDFIAHMKKQKSSLKSAKVTIKYIIAENNQVSTVHIVDAVKKNGEIVKFQINALYVVKDNKIILVDELTHMIKGNKSDKDLGSSK